MSAGAPSPLPLPPSNTLEPRTKCSDFDVTVDAGPKAHHIGPAVVYTADGLELCAPQDIRTSTSRCDVVLGAFHPKYMVVDGRVTLIISNNTQDR
ncbi:hypothetical protein FIBSPDRAFT_864131 [Athelia psychrophila]|uniref:PLD phosphodiesterase domain-containing protein n=1 Tax=Athelia psychrophila TaxID=1759441 RepID=A0A166GUX0_9AGAM|nr:hypothetical protein FIBSPDRAFT_864131 [Fibularhizoctonia sp. CBS 109695]